MIVMLIYVGTVILRKKRNQSALSITGIKICKNINKKQHMKLTDHILEKREASLKRKKGFFFSLSKKKGRIFFHFQGAHFFVLLLCRCIKLMLIHETSKIGPGSFSNFVFIV